MITPLRIPIRMIERCIVQNYSALSTLTRRFAPPSPSGRGWREAPGEGRKRAIILHDATLYHSYRNPQRRDHWGSDKTGTAALFRRRGFNPGNAAGNGARPRHIAGAS